MNLEKTASINAFADDCVWLWNNWTKQPKQILWARLISAINTRVGFLPPLNFQKINKGPVVYAYFSFANWSVSLNYDVLDYRPPLPAILEWVTAAYHECRHAEQAYQIAMGLLCGELELAGKDRIHKQQALANRSFQQIRQGFETGNPFEVDATARKQMVEKWLRMPKRVIDHADLHRATFTTLSSTDKNLVRDCMKTFFQGDTKRMSEEIQFAVQEETGSSSGVAVNLKAVYKGLAEEKDAHAVQDLVSLRILNRLGMSLPTNANAMPPMA